MKKIDEYSITRDIFVVEVVHNIQYNTFFTI